jgi:uncharacterized membrane protein YfcA
LLTLNLIIIPLIFLAALLYSSVGHGGASAYLAVMALVGIAPESMRPAALILNILVSSIALYKFYRASAFSWRLLLPLAAASIPCAFLGGLINLPAEIYKPIVGLVLVFAAWQVFSRATKPYTVSERTASKVALFGIGGCLGMLSGLTGVGGGIFLSPVLLFLRWAETKTISGTAAAFILVNSISGLIGVLAKLPALPQGLAYWAFAAIVGGWVGAEYGSKRLANPTIRQLLALVLLIAGAKMVISG